MYYPKSQIKPSQYTNGGEFIVYNTGEPYKGFYYETSKGEYYTNKSPNEIPTYLLIPNQSEDTQNLPDNLQVENFPDSYYVINDRYYKSKGLSYNRNTPTPPKSTYPKPLLKDYQTGEFERYFLKKSNEAKFIEVSKEDYGMYISKDNSVPYELYIPTKISWILKGNKDQVYQANKNIVGKVERKQNYYGFTSYFKDNFTQFYQ